MSKKIKLCIGVIIISLLIIVSYFSLRSSLPVDKNAWQAVFLTNNQVYFGKLSSSDGEYLELTKVFYLRSNQNINENTDESANLDLIKLGAEIHGPEDKMYISKKQIIFWENLKSDSKIVRIINNYK